MTTQTQLKPPTLRSNCGTLYGYQLHRKNGEQKCPDCFAAQQEANRRSYDKTRAVKLRDLGPRSRDWLDQAVCAEIGGTGWDSCTPQQKARICQGCPVLSECLAWGLMTQTFGGDVYGGRWVEQHQVRPMPADPDDAEEAVA